MTTFDSYPVDLLTERQTRIQLAAAYRILADMKMDDLTYTHLSARLPGSQTYFIRA